MKHPGTSDLVEIASRNGDFRRNYGRLLGAFLYLRSVNAAAGRSLFRGGMLLALLSVTVVGLANHGFFFLVRSVCKLF